jgi:hypothetical protein
VTLKAWGTERVSSALEVFLILQTPPANPLRRDLWQELPTIEPPFWGSLMHQAPSVRCLVARGYRVWSWDDDGAVLSRGDAGEPLEGLQYRTWAYLRHEHEDAPTHPLQAESPSSTCIHDDTEALSAPRGTI